MKRILITNDDGYLSQGLIALARELSLKYKVKVVAPASQKSACSHSITLNKPLKFIKIKKNFYKLDNGTPADCVYLALVALYKKKLPDLVISGINHGANVGEDITYSGTCGGAMEAVLHGINALALSKLYERGEKTQDYSKAIKITKKLVKKIFKEGFPLKNKEFLNVNFPSTLSDYKGLKVIKAGERLYNYKASKNTNPRGLEYYWLGENNFSFVDDMSSDISLLKQGYATITPIMLDLTAYNSMKELEKWL